MRVWWRSRPRAALARTSSASRRAAVSTTLFVGTTLAACSVLAAEGAPPPSALPDQLKALGTEHGLLGLLLAIALGAIATLFWLYIKAIESKGTAVAKKDLEIANMVTAHIRELAAKDADHAKDRNEWFAQTTILQENRANLIREVVGVTNNATTTIEATQKLIQERQATAQELTSRIAELVSVVQLLRSNSTEENSAIRKTIRCLSEEVEASLKRLNDT